MFKMLILVCSTALSPSDCKVDTATSVINGPEAANEIQCGLHGQAYLANTAIVHSGKNEYIKIRCSRTTIGQTVG